MACTAAALAAALFTAGPAAAQDTEPTAQPGEAPSEPIPQGASDDSLSESQTELGTQKEDTQENTAAAGAQPTDAAPEKPTPTDFGHGGQFGLRANLAYGYKILIRYEDSPPCDIGGDGADEKVCAYGTPGSLDLAASFALLDGLEPYLWFRLGLTDHAESFTAASRWFGAGVRIYTMSDSQLKLFFEPALAVEFEGALPNAPATANYATDFVGHLHFGLQYDIVPYVGLYASVGPNVNFVRAIGTELEGAFGLQVRGP
jgi:opacity protein-like surface antigen